MKLSLILAAVVLGGCAHVTPQDTRLADADTSIVIPAKPHNMFPQDWDVYQGKYDLSNGQVLVMRRVGLTMGVEASGMPRRQLIAASPNDFVSSDGRLRITLVSEVNGHVTGRVVMVTATGIAVATINQGHSHNGPA